MVFVSGLHEESRDEDLHEAFAGMFFVATPNDKIICKISWTILPSMAVICDLNWIDPGPMFTE